MNNIIQNNNVESFSMNNSHIIEEEFNYIRENLSNGRIKNLDEIGELYDENIDKKYDCF